MRRSVEFFRIRQSVAGHRLKDRIWRPLTKMRAIAAHRVSDAGNPVIADGAIEEMDIAVVVQKSPQGQYSLTVIE